MKDEQPHQNIDLLVRYFSEECSPEERKLMLQWKEASPENQAEFMSFKKVWDSMETTNPDQIIDIEAAWEEHQINYIGTIQPGKTRNLWNNTLKIAASLIIFIGLSYFGWNYFTHKTVTTDLASTQEMVLPDGSRVSLNAGSRLDYASSFGSKNRSVKLKGEAYFEVAHQPDKPFIISVNGIDVKVLGTKFNIRANHENENIEVTVAEGTVTVYRHGQGNDQVVVTRGQQAVYQINRQQIIKKENTDKNYIAWKTHTIIFENDSLTNIIKTLQSVYHQEFELENESLKSCTLTTSFENKDLGEILKIMKKTLDISFEEKDGKIIIKGKGC